MIAQTERPRLLPREHGTYAELGFPLLAALLLAGRSLPALALALAYILVFLAHEPLLVLLGQRGTKAFRLWHVKARWALAWRTALAAALFALGLWLSPAHAYVWVGIGILGLFVLSVLIYLQQERSSYGEILATALLCFASVPVSLAASANHPLVASIFLVWCMGYILNTLAVRMIIIHKKRTVPIRSKLLVPMLAVAAIMLIEVLALQSWVLRPTAIVATPLVLAASTCSWVAPSPRHLRNVGWSVVAASALTLVLMLALF